MSISDPDYIIAKSSLVLKCCSFSLCKQAPGGAFYTCKVSFRALNTCKVSFRTLSACSPCDWWHGYVFNSEIFEKIM